MTRDNGAHGQDGDKVRDTPVVGNEGGLGENDHDGDEGAREDHGELELLEHLGHLDEEVGELGLLGRGTPGHVDLEHMRQQGLRHVQRKTAEEDGKEEGPLEVLNQVRDEISLACSPAHHCQADVAEAVEYNDDGEPHLPRVQVVLVEITVEPTHGKVVDSGEEPGSTDSVVGTNVLQDC